MVTPKKVLASRGATWLGEGLRCFKENPKGWLQIVALGFLITFGLMLFGSIGQLIFSLASYVLLAGLLRGIDNQQAGGSLGINDLFSAFNKDSVNVLIFSGVVLLINQLIVAVTLADFHQVIQANPPETPEEVILLFSNKELFLYPLMIAFALMVPVLMASFFAVPLIIFQNLSVLEAMKQSFLGCSKNVGAMTIYGIILIGLYLLVFLSLFIGLVLFIPVFIGSIYFAYKDIYGSADAAPRNGEWTV